MKESPVQNNKKRVSIFGRGENSTVIMMLIFFSIAIILIQLITSAAAGKIVYPSFISPVNLLNILMQVAATGVIIIVAVTAGAIVQAK